MEYYTISILLSVILCILVYLKVFPKLITNTNLPPGPKPWPIIGNIHLLGDKPHRAIDKLSKMYGPIMSLKLGSITTVIVASPEIAKEMFTKHDLAFSSRNVPYAARVANHDKFSMIWLPVSPKWRDLRKVITIQLFTSQRLDSTQVPRQKKVNELVEYAAHCCENGLPVDIGKAAYITSLNLLSNTFFSIDLASHDSSSLQEFKDVAWHYLEELARPNVADLFPVLKHLDLQGVMKRMQGYFYYIVGVFEEIIDKRLKDEMGSKDDVLGILLNQDVDSKLSLEEIKHMLVDLFIAGTDTASTTIEWAMTELLRAPEKMRKAQDEIVQVIGKNGSVQESDISKLPYIQAIVKETFRLHPPVPFLLPHKTEEDAQLGSYHIPKNAQVWINTWTIGRDPSLWSNPQSFAPERFLDREIDLRAGRDFELIPFGSGRRMCPGVPLAYRMVHLMLANLLHSFNWKHGNELNPEDIDVEEKFALSLQKVQPLLAVPLPRQFR